MASHIDLGRYGEELGKDYLSEKNFAILFTNWRYSRYEIDIIASKENTLHFIEIKTRRTRQFGWPEESVDEKKMEKLMEAAEAFLYQYPVWKCVQYDILSISIGADNQPDFFLIEDVYI